MLSVSWVEFMQAYVKRAISSILIFALLATMLVPVAYGQVPWGIVEEVQDKPDVPVAPDADDVDLGPVVLEADNTGCRSKHPFETVNPDSGIYCDFEIGYEFSGQPSEVVFQSDAPNDESWPFPASMEIFFPSVPMNPIVGSVQFTWTTEGTDEGYEVCGDGPNPEMNNPIESVFDCDGQPDPRFIPLETDDGSLITFHGTDNLPTNDPEAASSITIDNTASANDLTISFFNADGTRALPLDAECIGVSNTPVGPAVLLIPDVEDPAGECDDVAPPALVFLQDGAQVSGAAITGLEWDTVVVDMQGDGFDPSDPFIQFQRGGQPSSVDEAQGAPEDGPTQVVVDRDGSGSEAPARLPPLEYTAFVDMVNGFLTGLLADDDTDSFPNIVEMALGSDPTDTADTPVDDRDADGFLNFQEAAAGSDPSNEESTPVSVGPHIGEGLRNGGLEGLDGRVSRNPEAGSPYVTGFMTGANAAIITSVTRSGLQAVDLGNAGAGDPESGANGEVILAPFPGVKLAQVRELSFWLNVPAGIPADSRINFYIDLADSTPEATDPDVCLVFRNDETLAPTTGFEQFVFDLTTEVLVSPGNDCGLDGDVVPLGDLITDPAYGRSFIWDVAVQLSSSASTWPANTALVIDDVRLEIDLDADNDGFPDPLESGPGDPYSSPFRTASDPIAPTVECATCVSETLSVDAAKSYVITVSDTHVLNDASNTVIEAEGKTIAQTQSSIRYVEASFTDPTGTTWTETVPATNVDEFGHGTYTWVFEPVQTSYDGTTGDATLLGGHDIVFRAYDTGGNVGRFEFDVVVEDEVVPQVVFTIPGANPDFVAGRTDGIVPVTVLVTETNSGTVVVSVHNLVNGIVAACGSTSFLGVDARPSSSITVLCNPTNAETEELYTLQATLTDAAGRTSGTPSALTGSKRVDGLLIDDSEPTQIVAGTATALIGRAATITWTGGTEGVPPSPQIPTSGLDHVEVRRAAWVGGACDTELLSANILTDEIVYGTTQYTDSTALVDGVVCYFARVVDAAGNPGGALDGWQAFLPIRLDGTGPSITGVSVTTSGIMWTDVATGNKWFRDGDSLGVSASVSDVAPQTVDSARADFSDINAGHGTSAMTGVGGLYTSVSVPITTLTVGPHTVRVGARDSLLNDATPVASASIRIDSVEPVLDQMSFTLPTGQTAAKDGDLVTFSVRAIDGLTDVVSVVVLSSTFSSTGLDTACTEGDSNVWTCSVMIDVNDPQAITVSARATDAVGNFQITPFSPQLAISNGAPVLANLAVQYPTGRTFATTGDSLVLTGQVVSVADTAAQLTLTLNPADSGDVLTGVLVKNGDAGTVTFSRSVTLDGDGPDAIGVTATTRSGLTVTGTFAPDVDRVSPMLQSAFTAPTSSAPVFARTTGDGTATVSLRCDETPGLVTVSVNVYDPITETVVMTLSESGVQCAGWGTPIPVTFDVPTLPSVAQKRYMLRDAVLTDRAGLTSGAGSVNCGNCFIVDNDGPLAPGAPTATPNGGDVDLVWTAATDAQRFQEPGHIQLHSGVAQYQVLVVSPCEEEIVGTTSSLTFSDVMPGRVCNYKIRAVDVAGNLGTLSAQGDFESGEPTVFGDVVSYPVDQSSVKNGQPIVISVTVTDAQEVDQGSVRGDLSAIGGSSNAVFLPEASVDALGNGVYTTTLNSVSGTTGTQTVTITAKDVYGTVSDALSVDVRVDNTNPIVTIVSPTTGTKIYRPSSGVLPVQITYDDAFNGQIRIHIEDRDAFADAITSDWINAVAGSTATYNVALGTGVLIPFTEDEYNVLVEARDGSLLTGEARQPRALSIDNTPPSTPSLLTATVLSGGDVALDWSDSTDALSGIDEYLVFYQLDTAPDGTGTPVPVSGTEHTLLELGTGEWHFRVAALDRAGLQSGLSNDLTAIPNGDPPSIEVKATEYDGGGPLQAAAKRGQAVTINVHVTDPILFVAQVTADEHTVTELPGDVAVPLTQDAIITSLYYDTLTIGANVANGEYKIPIHAEDNVGNAVDLNCAVSACPTILVDAVNPSLNVFAPEYPTIGTAAARNGDLVTVSANAFDFYGIWTVTADVSAVTGNVLDTAVELVSVGGVYELGVTVGVGVTEPRQVTIKATDQSGLQTTGTVNVAIDNTPTTVTALSTIYPTGQAAVKGGQSVTVQVEASHSLGVASVTLTPPAGLFASPGDLALTHATGNLWTATILVTAAPVDDLYVLPGSVVNNVGLVTAIVAGPTVLVDKTAPTGLDVTSPTTGSPLFVSTGSIGTVEFAFTEANPQTSSLVLQNVDAFTVSDATLVTVAFGATTGSMQFRTDETYEGEYNLVFTLVDKSLQTVSTPEPLSLILDNTPPVVEPAAVVQSFALGSMVTLNARAIDFNFGQVEMVTVDANAITIADSSDTSMSKMSGTFQDGTWQVVIEITDPTAAGTVAVPVTAIDKAGLRHTATFMVTVDSIAPAIGAPALVLPTSSAGFLQTAIKSGDTFAVSATATDIGGTGVAPTSVKAQVDGVNTGSPVSMAFVSGTTYGANVLANHGSLATGTYLVTVSANDLAGNTGVSAGTLLAVDQDAPIIVTVRALDLFGDELPPEGIENGQAVLLRVTTTDVGSGIALVTVDASSIGASSSLELEPNSPNAYEALVTVSGAQGMQSLPVSVFDGAGASDTDQIALKISNAAPIIATPETAYPAGQTAIRPGQSVTLSLSATDDVEVAGAVIDTSLISETATTAMLCTGPDDSKTCSVTVAADKVGLVGASFALLVTVSDATLPVALEATQAFTVDVDSMLPTVSHDAITGVFRAGNTIPVSLNIVDPSFASGIASARVDTSELGGGLVTLNVQSIGAASTIATGTVSVTISTSGTVDLLFTAFDRAGNQATILAVPVQIDNTGPSVNADAVSGHFKPGATIGLSGTATDAGSSVSAVTADATAILGGASNALTLVGDDWSGDVVVGSVASGVYLVTVRATDLAGNTATTAVSVNVDAQAPSSVVTPLAAPVRNGATFEVVATVTDLGGSGVFSVSVDAASVGGGTVALTLDSGVWSGEVTVTSTATNHAASLTLTATDAAGNSAITLMPVDLDNTNPTLSVDPVPGFLKVGAGFTLTATATDDTDVSSVSAGAHIVGDAANKPLTSSGGASWSALITIGTDVMSGEYALVVVATDAAGNTESTMTSVRVDALAPVVVPVEQTAPVRTGDTVLIQASVSDLGGSGISSVSATATSLNPGATDVVLTLNPTSGKWEGSVEVTESVTNHEAAVTIIATDAAGNVGSASLTLDLDNNPVVRDIVVNYPTFVPGGTAVKPAVTLGDTVVVEACVRGGDDLEDPELVWVDPATALFIETAGVTVTNTEAPCAVGTSTGDVWTITFIVDNPLAFANTEQVSEAQVSEFRITATETGNVGTSDVAEVLRQVDGGALLPVQQSAGGGSASGDVVQVYALDGIHRVRVVLFNPVDGSKLIDQEI